MNRSNLTEPHPRRLVAPGGDHARGFTVVELMVVVAIIAVLGTVLYPALGHLNRRAEDSVCASRIKKLHTAFNAHLIEHGMWPQIPGEVLDDEDWEAQWKWWHDVMAPYGVGRDDWLCPVEQKALNKSPAGERPFYHSSYIPTTFDSETSTPHRWAQPWVMERGSFHRDGSRLLMPDGSIEVTPLNLFGQ